MDDETQKQIDLIIKYEQYLRENYPNMSEEEIAEQSNIACSDAMLPILEHLDKADELVIDKIDPFWKRWFQK